MIASISDEPTVRTSTDAYAAHDEEKHTVIPRISVKVSIPERMESADLVHVDLAQGSGSAQGRLFSKEQKKVHRRRSL